MDHVGDEERLDREAALSKTDAKAEGHDGLVDDDGTGDTQHLTARQGVLSCATARPPVAASAGALSLAGSRL